MTNNEMQQLIGKSGMFNVPIHGADECGFIVPITIKDVRQAYGRVDFHVAPNDGTGAAWVPQKYITVTES